MVVASVTRSTVSVSSARHVLRRHGAVLFIYSLTLVLAVSAAVMSPSFRDVTNLTDVLRQSIALGLVTIGQAYVLLGGGIDMSVGMTARVVGIGAGMALSGTSLLPGAVIVVGLLCGALVGLVNGLLVTRLGAAPFIVTLGMMGLLHGVSLIISDGPTGLVPDSFLAVYETSVGPVPISVFGIVLVWLAALFVIHRTRFGRSVYAVGGSPETARLAGLEVARVRTWTYVVAGACAAAAGMFLLARSGVGDPSLGQDLEFQSIVAAAIGGVSLYGGRGSLVGAFGAVLLITLSSNIFDMFDVSGYYQQLVLGLIVLIGVAVYRSGAQR